jgi:hypothetical protein
MFHVFFYFILFPVVVHGVEEDGAVGCIVHVVKCRIFLEGMGQLVRDLCECRRQIFARKTSVSWSGECVSPAYLSTLPKLVLNDDSGPGLLFLISPTENFTTVKDDILDLPFLLL